MKIKDLMKKPVVIENDISLSDVAKLMTKHSINSLIIEKDDKIRGIVTHHDLVKYFGESKKVFDIMTKNVITLREDDKIQRAVDIIKENEIGIFPVVDSDDKIVGVLDSRDLLKVWDSDDFMID